MAASRLLNKGVFIYWCISSAGFILNEIDTMNFVKYGLFGEESFLHHKFGHSVRSNIAKDKTGIIALKKSPQINILLYVYAVTQWDYRLFAAIKSKNKLSVEQKMNQ